MDEDLKKMLEENLTLTRETHAMVTKIRRAMRWQRVVSIIYLILIIGPIIIAVFYLPPILGPVFQQYQELLGPTGGTGTPSVSTSTLNLPALLRRLEQPGATTSPGVK